MLKGNHFAIQRVPQFDTRDGRYLGFSSANAQQAIRWPVDGRGVMQIGDLNGTNWRPSRMQIQKVVPRWQKVARVTRALGRTYVAAVESGRNRTTVGYIDPEGNVQLFEGRGRIWNHRPIARVEGLVPGAPLAIALDPHSQIPLIYSATWDGELLEISEGRRVRGVAPELRFIPRTVLRLIDRGSSLQLFAVDRFGVIWNIDPAPGARPEAVEPRTERYDAGVPLFLIPGAADQLFLVDRGGALVSYSREGGRWLGPQFVDRGFVSGAHIAGALYNNVRDAPGAHVAAVDADGRIALYTETRGRWPRSPAPSAPFPAQRTADICSLRR